MTTAPSNYAHDVVEWAKAKTVGKAAVAIITARLSGLDDETQMGIVRDLLAETSAGEDSQLDTETSAGEDSQLDTLAVLALAIAAHAASAYAAEGSRDEALQLLQRVAQWQYETVDGMRPRYEGNTDDTDTSN